MASQQGRGKAATARAVCLCTGWLLATACSDDSSATAGAEGTDAHQLGDLQVQGDIAGLADVTASDAGADPAAMGLPAWLTGTWPECSGVLTVSAPDVAVWQEAGGTCSVRAKVVWQQGALDFTVTEQTGCPDGSPGWLTTGTRASFDGTQLSLVHPTLFTGIKRFSHKPLRQRWNISNAVSGGHMDLCFDENGRFFDGRWRTNGDCFFISCGAIVTQVKNVGAEKHIWTECQGGCPCASILIVTAESSDAMSGHFTSAGCTFSDSGPFSAVRAPFPGG